MSRNPFSDNNSIASAASEDRLLAVCEENNRWAYRSGYRRWYFVQPAIDGSPASIATIDGVAVDEVWSVSRGERLDYASWTHARLDKLERRCRWLVERGMSHDAFAALRIRYGWTNPTSVAA